MVQMVGAVMASVVVGILVQDQSYTFLIVPGEAATVFQSLLVEILFTFALALVFLNTASAENTEGNSYYGLAIGFTVAVALFAGGEISGGAFNPAVGVAPNLINQNFPDIWIYAVGPLLGGTLAGLIFKFQQPKSGG